MELAMPNLSVLDASTLRGLRELGGDDPQELLDELFVLLFASADKQVEEIRSAVATDNLDAIMRAAHMLRGGAGSVGALEVAFIAGQIEARARARENAGWQSLADELELALSRLRETASGLGLKTAA
jgi:HPt (histidine-containing phosphotransfer) domain-containing protein